MRLPSRTSALACAALACLMLAACGRSDEAETASGTDGAAAAVALPQPGQASGAITDMPATPGPGDVPLAGEPPPPPPLFPAGSFGVPLLEENPETGLGTAEPAIGGTGEDLVEPTPADAVDVVRQYYAALAARDFARAHGLWADGGNASDRTPDQFAAGFVAIENVQAQVGQPGPVEGAAGSRYIQVPIGIAETLADGSVRKQVGVCTLRRAVVDGATPSQREWRIASMELRDHRPDAAPALMR